jgi:hypothetical protein
MSDDVLAELERARDELGLSREDFALLPNSEAREIVARVIDTFVQVPEARWWWEHLKQPGLRASFRDDKAYSRLTRLLPSAQEKAWLIAEPDESQVSVFSATPATLERVLGECLAFEYYVVGAAMDWLVCENHHGVLTVVGTAVEERLCGLLDALPDEVAWSGRG